MIKKRAWARERWNPENMPALINDCILDSKDNFSVLKVKGYSMSNILSFMSWTSRNSFVFWNLMGLKLVPELESSETLAREHFLGLKSWPARALVTQRSNRQAQEKIPCYGEFTQRSDPWAGLIASCGSFYPMVHHSAAHSLDTSLTCGTSLWLIFGCPDYFLRNGVHISAGPEEVNRKELASVKPSARKWEWEKRRPENQPSNSGSTVHQIKS